MTRAVAMHARMFRYTHERRALCNVFDLLLSLTDDPKLVTCANCRRALTRRKKAGTPWPER